MNISINNIKFSALPQKPHITKIIKEPARQHTSSEKGMLNDYNMKLLSEIRDLFELAHSYIKATAKSCNTRTSIKNGYPSLKRGIAGSRILEFLNIGNKGENISVNLRVDHGNEKKTIIAIGEKQLVINAKGQIEKNPSLRFVNENNVRRKSEKLQFFSQKEIDDLDTDKYFFALKKELLNYINYILNRQRSISNLRMQRADNTPGNLDTYKSLIDNINENFQYFKTHIIKLSANSLDKDIFRMYNRIKTFTAQNSILLKDVTPDGRSIFVGYTKFNQKKLMKIFVMDYNNKDIDKSFIIYENKLAKYKPKKVNDRPKHQEYDFHYYTQEEIDNSELEKYMNITLERLEEVNDNLKQGIEERKSKI